MRATSSSGPANRALRLLVVAALTMVVVGCGEPPPDDRVPGPQLLEESAPELTGAVAMTEDGFDTTRLELAVDQGFELTNASDGPHRIQGRRDDQLIFDTGDMLPGETTVIVVNSEGTVTFTDRDDPDLHFEVVARSSPE